MYDLVVIGNIRADRFHPSESITRYVRVHYICDRSAYRPDHYQRAIERSKIKIDTDHYFAVRAEQAFLDMDWLRPRVDLLDSETVVMWPVRIEYPDDRLVEIEKVDRLGLCLMPNTSKPYSELKKVSMEDPCTITLPYPVYHISDFDSQNVLKAIHEIALRVEHPYFHVIPLGMEFQYPNHPLIDPDQSRADKNPIYHGGIPKASDSFGIPDMSFDSGIMTVPASIVDSEAPLNYLFHGGGWPNERSNLFGSTEFAPDYLYDIVMLTNGESCANRHWDELVRRYPRAKRLDGIKGILAAHVRAAELADTDYFFVVDADNLLHDKADLDSIKIPQFDKPSIIVWKAANSANGLCYGYGGVKLFHRRTVLEMKHADIYRDFTGMVAARSQLGVSEHCWSTTVIDSTPYEGFRSGFRETLKLALWLADPWNSNSPLREIHEDRLRVWKSTATGPNGVFVLAGAHISEGLMTIVGTDIASDLINNEQKIRKIFLDFKSDYDKDPIESSKLIRDWARLEDR